MSIKRYRKWKFIIPAAVVGFALLALAGGWIVSQLWNWLLPTLFGFPTVTIWQALGLLALTRILFGGFGGGGTRPSRKMSVEEREQIRQRMCERFPGNSHSPTGE